MPVKRYVHTTYAVECDYCNNARLDVEHEDFKEELKEAEKDGWIVEDRMYGYRFTCPDCVSR